MLAAGAAIGAGMKAGAAIYGGLKQSKAMSQVMKNLKNQMKENQDWYDRRYNEDATQRADAQALLTQTEDSIRRRNAQAAGTAAVMGGTEESVAAAREANNKALTDTVSNIAVNADARKDNIEQQYMKTKSDLNEKINNMTLQKAQNEAAAVQGVADAGASMASGLK